MTDGDDERLVAACEQCGSMYAALELPNGEIRPIGSRDGCTSCGGTAFTPVPEFANGADGSESGEAADDD